MKKAVCAIIPNDHFEFLTVTRKDSSLYGLPGGKIDAGEEPLEALVREVREETGLIFCEEDFKPVYTAMEGGFEVITYALTRRVSDHTPRQWCEEPNVFCEFLPEHNLTSNKGAFPVYNKAAIDNYYERIR